jgi:hypothetical protein
MENERWCRFVSRPCSRTQLEGTRRVANVRMLHTYKVRRAGWLASQRLAIAAIPTLRVGVVVPLAEPRTHADQLPETMVAQCG